ncbi:organic solute transporter subunit beta isoform X2 [Rhinatrema bivittatum]|uniref:organic solute transporter subunit beta isoform X2 n=1 Tax=Rhinatrema bivittatum TaxID=194408 RepID=UPI00112DA57A|nr:organic solute transporter subunit beta isoform X2 [Rhinatrema bivittatum]
MQGGGEHIPIQPLSPLPSRCAYGGKFQWPTLLHTKSQEIRKGVESANDPNTRLGSATENNVSSGMGLTEEQLQHLLWLFRTEDASAWNYSILGLSFAGLLLGCLILGMNIMANRNRKLLHRYKTEPEAPRTAEAGKKQATELPRDSKPLKKEEDEQNLGDITIQWKDGNVTSLYNNTPEEDV